MARVNGYQDLRNYSKEYCEYYCTRSCLNGLSDMELSSFVSVTLQKHADIISTNLSSLLQSLKTRKSSTGGRKLNTNCASHKKSGFTNSGKDLRVEDV